MWNIIQRRYALSLAVVLVLVVIVLLGQRLLHHNDQLRAQPHQSSAGAESPEISGAGAVVTLNQQQLKSAGIQLETVRRGTLTHTHSVPGRVVYNDNRHVEVTSPTSGIVTQMLVQPGDQVEAWQVLAWLNSPEIGSARADVLQRQAEAELTQKLAERAASMEKNVLALTAGLRKQANFDALREELAGRVLGDYRDKLFGAYSRLQVAEKMVANSTALGESGALSGKIILGYQAEQMGARSALEAACEQADLEVWQASQQAQSAAQNVQRRLEIARQHLSSLLLSEAAINPAGNMPPGAELGANDNDLEHLSRVAIRAPFRGTIESRKFSASERVQATDSLFVLADTSSLWITAEIRENDWPALSLVAGQPLQVTAPALGREALTATVEFIGREVSPETNAIPIIARIENPQGRLRPGLFVRVAVPVVEKSDILTIPSSAVMQHDGVSYVFVAETDNRFRQAAVVTSDEAEELVGIVSGLKVNDRVVTHGAFLLKSELLLENEEE